MAEGGGKRAEMSFWEHLDVLRGSVIRVLTAVCALSCIGLAFKEPLFRLILAPADPDFFVYRLMGASFSMELINVDISAQFFVHLKASLAMGFILAFPYAIWELWRFIVPALYPGERKAVGRTFLLSSGLFYLGAAVGYLIVLPFCVQFFMNYSVSPDITNAVTLRSYISMFSSLVLLMGICFEFPSAIVLLSTLGVVDRPLLKRGRKYAFIVLLIVAAFITPTGDPLSMLLLAAPLYLLYELSILLCSSQKNP